MRKIVFLIVMLIIPVTVNAGWFDSLFGKSYSYNVLFYMPSGEEKFLGNAKSISSCQNMAGYGKVVAEYGTHMAEYRNIIAECETFFFALVHKTLLGS